MIHLLHKEGLRDAVEIADGLRARGAQVVPLASESSDHIAALLASADIARLVVAGGDGMVHHALQHVAGSDIELGIVPAGTGNDIARALKIGRRRDAIQTALFPARPTDLVRITDEARRSAWVLSILTAGFSGTVTKRANEIQWIGGQAKYTAATLACLPKLAAHRVSGLDDTDSFAILALANTRFFGGGMAMCPTADPNDGEMEIVVVDHVHPLHLAAVLPAAFVGQHIRSRRVHQFSRQRVTLETDAAWWADGEPLPHTGQVTVEAVAGAVSIARPK